MIYSYKQKVHLFASMEWRRLPRFLMPKFSLAWTNLYLYFKPKFVAKDTRIWVPVCLGQNFSLGAGEINANMMLWNVLHMSKVVLLFLP